MLGHVLSEEQSKDGSDDGCLTIVQCHHYHWPPLSDLYWSSIGILPLLRYHQQTCILIITITNQHHVLSTAAQSEPVPELHTDSEEEEPEEAEEPIKPGDCIFAIGLVPAPAEIRVTSSVSQCLAKAFKRNSESAPSGRSILEYLKEFDSVFSKESFDVLPESKKWDHAVKLIPGEMASNCKVYPLALKEQKELINSSRKTWKQVESVRLNL